MRTRRIRPAPAMIGCAFVLVPLLGAGCSEDLTEAELAAVAGDDVHPDSLIAWQEGDLVLGKVVYNRCSEEWDMDYVPSGDPVVLDFSFSYDPRFVTDPTDEHVALIEAAGGTVHHRFSVPILRASIPRAQIAEKRLWHYSLARAHVVPRGDRFDVSVTVMHSGDAEGTKDAFRELGGFVRYEWPTVNSFSGVLPDSGIAHLRAMDEVREVFTPGVYCFAS